MQQLSSEPRSFAGFVHRNRRFFLIWALVALGFRCFFLLKFPLLTVDSFIYGEIAKNWLQHGIYGQTFSTGPEATFIRLPGYPIFLILTWAVAGVEHYTAVLIAQVAVDTATCFVVADLARRIGSERAAKVAFVLTALCPFFANYAAVALTETWAIFLAALAMDFAVMALDEPWRKACWVWCGAALALGILLRPDGGMLLIVIGGCALVLAIRKRAKELIVGTALMGIVALAPLVPWTIRNWHTFHLFQPLAPFNANMPWEFVPHGFHRWTRTWMADYSSVEDVWFNVNGDVVTIGDLPPRAYDDGAQRQRTDELFKAYAANGNNISPVIDEGFAALARERIHAHPFRYYVRLPLLRAADLWLRPRTEMLPIDPHWWRLREDDPRQFWWAVLLGTINLVYIVGATVALAQGKVKYAALFLAFAIFRTAFLSWMPNPEPRYVLECYPALLAIAGAVIPSRNRYDRVESQLTAAPAAWK
jgi:4-amino-4-deoxy-L-arabinose transferase-like glycosyltransferase